MLVKKIFIKPSQIILEDGSRKNSENMFYGGISYIDETLDNFLEEINMNFNTITVLELLQALNECNIKIKNLKQVLRW